MAKGKFADCPTFDMVVAFLRATLLAPNSGCFYANWCPTTPRKDAQKLIKKDCFLNQSAFFTSTIRASGYKRRVAIGKSSVVGIFALLHALPLAFNHVVLLVNRWSADAGQANVALERCGLATQRQRVGNRLPKWTGVNGCRIWLPPGAQRQ
jgi:hypothetical protein